MNRIFKSGRLQYCLYEVFQMDIDKDGDWQRQVDKTVCFIKIKRKKNLFRMKTN